MFTFKQFTINQDRCAMKVGTDGVLLGAWTPIATATQTILDIGAGTGIIALMLAQRCNAQQIDAIEIEDNAYEQCVENFENSPWADRLFCYHASLDAFLEEMEEETCDLIISNPPFFTEEYSSASDKRDLARFESSLPFAELVHAAANLLSENGVFALIVPFKEEAKIIALAKEYQLFPFHITHVKGTPTSQIKRSLLAFSWEEKSCKKNELTIEISRHNYTDEYIALTKDFYVKM